MPSDCLTPSSSSKSLVRSPSSPSLAHELGLPPAQPDSGILPLNSAPKSISYRYPSGSHVLARVGDVDSRSPSLASSLASNPARDTSNNMVVESPSTPRRKIVNSIDVPTPRSAAKKRSTLQDRLNSVAAPTKIPRMSSLPPVNVSPRPSSMPPAPVNHATPLSIPSTSGPSREIIKSSDKVVVCMRIKPTASRFSQFAYEVTPQSLTLSDVHPSVLRRGGKAGRESEYSYNFDSLVQYPTKTPQLYNDKIAPLVQKAMNGFNSTVFAYGQTGSGKSHTMSGTRQELGIIPCAVDGIFDAITADPDRAFLLRVSYLEIYNESIRDLLNFQRDNGAKQPTIKSGKGKVFVDPLVETIVSTPADVVEILSQGNSNRKTGATDWNERSSRSHAVFTIIIESRPRESDGHDEIRVSRLTLIDLAGSEKAVSDIERRGEGKHINQSLLALREVVHKLTETGKRGHIPYRNSKLTHLLENVLGGDSNICVICTMSAEEEHCSETLETLKFAGRCSQVETKAQKNILHGSDLAVIRAKDREIAELKRQLESMASSPPPAPSSIAPEQMSGLADELAAMEARKAKLGEQLAKLNGEILTSELPRSGVGLPVEQGRKRRPRISDFSSLSQASLGIGMGIPGGTPKKTVDRRAVSTMVRVTEDFYNDDDPDTSFVENAIENLAPGKPFDNDITIASLRRTIASRDGDLAQQTEKLNAALAQASDLDKIKDELAAAKVDLDVATSQYTKKLSDAQETFVSTQAALEKTIAEKTSRVDELEASIAELRESHEKLSAEAREEFAKVHADLESVTQERDAHLKEIEDLKASHSAEIAQIKEAIKTLRAQADEKGAKVIALEYIREELTASLAKVEGEREAAVSDHATAKREVEQAKTDLEAFQQSSKGRESEAMASFKTELDKERDLRTKAEIALDEATKEAQARAKELGEEKERLEKSLEDANDKLAATEKHRADAERRVEEVGAAHDSSKKEAQAAADAAQARHDELSAQVAALTAESDGHRTTGEKLVAQLEQLKAQLEEKTMSHTEVTRRLGEAKDELEKKVASNDETSRNLDSLKAELEEKVKALEEASKERDEIKADLESKTASHDETSRGLKTELDEKIKLLEAAVQERDETKGNLEKMTAAHDEISTALNTLKAELEEKTKAFDNASRERDEIQRSLDKATSQGEETAKELKALQDQLAEKNKAHAETESLLEASKAELSGKITALESATAEANTLTQKLKDATTAHTNTEGQLAAIKSELEAKGTSLAAATTEIDSLRAGANIAESVRAELDDHRKLLDEEKAERAKLTELHAAATTRGDTLATEVGETKTALEAEKEAHAATTIKLASTDARIAELEAELAASRKEREELASKLEESCTGRTELQGKLDVAERDLGDLKTQLESAETSTRSTADTHRSELGKLTAEVEEYKRAASTAEEQLASLTSASATKASELADELATAKSQLEERQKASSELQASLATAEAKHAATVEKLNADLASATAAQATTATEAKEASAAREAAELALTQATTELANIKAQLESATASSQDLEAVASQNSRLEKELTLAQSEQAALQSRCERLATELVDAQRPKAPPSSFPRSSLPTSSSVPGMLSNAGSLSLREKRSHAADEIAKLDKVVTAQKSVIEEQRTKIASWADELDRQREAVRQLSANLEGCTCSPSAHNGLETPPPRRHMRTSLSMSSMPLPAKENLENMSPAPNAYNSSRSRGHITSSFTAKNLALPSAPSYGSGIGVTQAGMPSPLPMHAAQFSNSSRKHRRVTLEHDINRLQESSRVSSIKSVFNNKDDTPPVTPVRHQRTGSIASSLRRG